MKTGIRRLVILGVALALLPAAAQEPALIPAAVEDTGQATCYDASGATTDEVPCAGTGQDGELRAGLAWPTPRFTDNGDGTVRDNLTGLVWLQDANCPGSAIYSLQAAFGFVESLNTTSFACLKYAAGTFDDWRLPNIKELGSLVDHDRSFPALPPEHPFENVPLAMSYWSSTTDAASPKTVWRLSVNFGTSSPTTKSSALLVWPVRGGPGASAASAAPAVILADGGLQFPDGSVQTTAGGSLLAPVEKTGQQTCWDESGATGNEITCDGTGQDGELRAGLAWPTPRFADNGDGTVTDNLTGLVWLKDADCPAGPMTLQAALDWVAAFRGGSTACTSYAAGAFDDWRLPNINELSSLLDLGQTGLPLPSGYPFVNVRESAYWSSSSVSHPSFASNAWVLTTSLFSAGRITYSAKSLDYHVWPVRGGR